MAKESSEQNSDPIEGYIKERAEREFREIMEGKREVTNSILLLLGISRLFYRMDDIKKGIDDIKKGMEDIKKTIRNSMYPIWISIVAGIIAYIVINVIGI